MANTNAITKLPIDPFINSIINNVAGYLDCTYISKNRGIIFNATRIIPK